eukprot:COSAG01_NODE_1043_length_11954_cov_9.077014_3_plen_90_part_00
MRHQHLLTEKELQHTSPFCTSTKLCGASHACSVGGWIDLMPAARAGHSTYSCCVGRTIITLLPHKGNFHRTEQPHEDVSQRDRNALDAA